MIETCHVRQIGGTSDRSFANDWMTEATGVADHVLALAEEPAIKKIGR